MFCKHDNICNQQPDISKRRLFIDFENYYQTYISTLLYVNQRHYGLYLTWNLQKERIYYGSNKCIFMLLCNYFFMQFGRGASEAIQSSVYTAVATDMWCKWSVQQIKYCFVFRTYNCEPGSLYVYKCPNTDWTIGVRSPAEAESFSCSHCVQTGCGPLHAAYPTATGVEAYTDPGFVATQPGSNVSNQTQNS
jgi:hypothetical protein